MLQFRQLRYTKDSKLGFSVGPSGRRLFVFARPLSIGCVRVSLHVRLLAGLDGILRSQSDLFAAMFLFLLDFFVDGDVAWACHLNPVVVRQRLSAPVPSQCAVKKPGVTTATP